MKKLIFWAYTYSYMILNKSRIFWVRSTYLEEYFLIIVYSVFYSVCYTFGLRNMKKTKHIQQIFSIICVYHFVLKNTIWKKYLEWLSFCMILSPFLKFWQIRA